ncbi:MAG: DNA-directed RNA polymerase subunit D [archaeon]|nr:DNA-directed RNA polymerase subunit D [archaeon]
MKLKVIDKDSSLLRIEISETRPAFVNALRRTIMQKIPVLAIETVDFIDNTSALYDEILAHRLGLIPFSFDMKSYVAKDGCKCKGKGCSSCEVKFVLKKKGPCTVYAKDMKSTDPDVKPADGNVIIVKLLKDQSLDMEATAQIGTAREHAKWQSSIVGFNYFPTLKVDKKRLNEAKACVDACPLGLITKDFKLKDPYSCNLCGSCSEACPKGAVTIEGDSSHIILCVESVSGLSPQDIIRKSLEILGNNIGEFEEAFKKQVK